MDEKKDSAVLLKEFLEKEGIELIPNKPMITFTENGGVIVQPSFSVRYKNETKNT